MTALALLDTLTRRGVRLLPDGDGLVIRPASRLTDADRAAIREHKTELLRLLSPAFDADTGKLAAVMLRGSVVGDVWLVADTEALAEHPDIIRSGLPVFFFDEIERLRGKTVDELRAIGMVKTVFPTGRVLQ